MKNGCDVLKGLLEEDPQWKNQLGKTGRMPYMKNDILNGQMYLDYKIFKYDEPRFSTPWYSFKPDPTKEEYSYIQILTSHSKAKMQILFTPKEHRRKGLATSALNSLKRLIDQTDYICKNQKHIDSKSFTLNLVPNPVDLMVSFPPEDWSGGFEKHFRDETFSEMGPYGDKTHSLEGLIQFYEKLGFIKCEKLRFTIKDGKQIFNMTTRSMDLKRPVIIYPPSNLDLVGQDYG